MKLILGALLVLTSPLRADVVHEVIGAITRVESQGYDSGITGDGGEALGLLQVHRIMVREAYRIAGVKYSWMEMGDPEKARRVAEIVLGYYSLHIRAVTGRNATTKELLFVWNGGGAAWLRVTHPWNDRKQAQLERYWSRAKIYLK